MNQIIHILSFLLISLSSNNPPRPEFIASNTSIEQYFKIGNLDTAKDTDKKTEAYNIKSDKIIKSVRKNAVEHSPALINCSDFPEKCADNKLIPPTPALSPAVYPTVFPRPTVIPHPSCPPPPPCYQRSNNSDVSQPCMYIDQPLQADIVCPELM